MKKNKRIIITMIVVAVFSVLTACQLDVVGKVSITSFEDVLNKTPDKVNSDTNGWVLLSPGGERFFWSKDFSNEGSPDAFIEFDAKPFIDAGLDVTKLPEGMFVDNKIIYKSELSQDKFKYQGESTAINSFKQIVSTNRDSIGYHEKLDHYGIKLGDGNMFEWAKDMKTNDKDIVFVVNPQPFIDAGVQTDKVEGWVFAKVDLKDDNGKPIQVDKFLKPYNLD